MVSNVFIYRREMQKILVFREKNLKVQKERSREKS